MMPPSPRRSPPAADAASRRRRRPRAAGPTAGRRCPWRRRPRARWRSPARARCRARRRPVQQPQRLGRHAPPASRRSRRASLARKCATRRGMSSRRSRSGGRLHGDHVDAEVEILAEAPGLHLVVEVPVGGADQAHVDADRLGAADRPDLAVLQRAQQLRLHLGPHVADLVEEQGAAVGHLEQAALGADGAGERAARVAEQLGLEQRLGQRRAVDRHERRVGARRVGVDGARDQLLAGARLARRPAPSPSSRPRAPPACRPRA